MRKAYNSIVIINQLLPLIAHNSVPQPST